MGAFFLSKSKATPHNIGAPEREARQRLPRDCYE